MSGQILESRAARIAWRLIPCVFCLWLYWWGLRSWFQADDFAWLGLPLELHSVRDLLPLLFAPKAQGTIRPWSERLFFLVFTWVFGIQPLPFHAWVFLTQCANLALIASIVKRLTGSRLAGFLAPVLWAANGNLGVALSWCSAYNEILCGFFLLASFRLLLAYIDTGRARYNVAQWIVFVLGFGALEINVVYPALALAYVFLCARKYVWKTLPLFVPSILFIWLHHVAAPLPASGPYALHTGAGMLQILEKYGAWVLGPAQLHLVRPVPRWLPRIGTALLAAGTLGFAGWKCYKRQYLAAFFVAWFVCVLLPVLPLADHISAYYLTVPAIGIAMLGGWAAAEGLRSGWAWRGTTAALVLLYLGCNIPIARAVAWWHFARGVKVESMIQGVVKAHELHPNGIILLADVDTDLFWGGFYDSPFRLYGIQDVYLAPGSEKAIHFDSAFGSLSNYVLAPGLVKRALEQGRASVYSAAKPPLRDITAAFSKNEASLWKVDLSRQLDAGQAVYADQLGEGWYSNEGGFRWMGKRATIRLGGPRTASERLFLSGHCDASQTQGGPLEVTVTAEGEALGTASVRKCGSSLDLDFALPACLVGKDVVMIMVEVNRLAIAPNDNRMLGLAFGTFAIR